MAKKLLEIASKVGVAGIPAKKIADNISQEDFDHLITLLMVGNDEITQRYLNHLQEKYGSGKSVKSKAKNKTKEKEKQRKGVKEDRHEYHPKPDTKDIKGLGKSWIHILSATP
ncbi:hypothetical protein [Xenorhabdus japonica]|uniref:Uncharacterized protein n=1 Tax=Xenorhabdus japonica TaxID=53341 RepID=A0A1I5D599_9GAMM|nr:hypothetical protein [Xenorhabdus japonica]SFN94399.1 hypothetical protein SAMN05421579_1351 [Xenorhabdus japonica]